MKVTDFIECCMAADTMPYDATQRRRRFVTTEKDVSRFVDDDPFKSELQRALVAPDEEAAIPKNELLKMSRGLTYELIINQNRSAQAALDVLNTLNALIGSGIRRYRPFEHRGWMHAIGLLKGFIAVNNRYCYPAFDYPDKAADRARAALRLRSFGVNVSLDDSDLKFENLDTFFSEIERRIDNFGGQKFICKLLESLQYVKEFGRFVIPAGGSGMTIPEAHDPSVPYNYLLNLGMKYLPSKGNARYQTPDSFLEIVELAKTVCFAIFSVESYSFWDNVFTGDKGPMEYVTDFILRESVFNLNQASPSFVINLVKYICRNVGSLIDESKLNFTLEEYSWLTLQLACRSDIRKFNTLLIRSIKNSHVRESSIRNIIDALSLPIAEYNQDYSHPSDYANVNFWNYPVARVDNDRILLFPRTIMVRGWYEGLLNILRRVDPQIDSKIGTVIENYLYDSFGKKDIECVSGDYVLPDNTEGECDALIQVSKNIILMEVKKRSLLRDSRAGIDYQILCNLIDVLKSQVQCLKTAYGLRNCSPFRIESAKGIIHEVSLGNRSIERITLTLFPYGAIQDRVIFEHIVELFLKYRFDVASENPDNDPEIKKKEEDIRTKLKPFNKIINELSRYLGLSTEERPLFNAWFMDLEQILYLINKSNGADEFAENLLKHKYLSTGSLDFYSEELALGLIQSGE